MTWTTRIIATGYNAADNNVYRVILRVDPEHSQTPYMRPPIAPHDDQRFLPELIVERRESADALGVYQWIRVDTLDTMQIALAVLYAEHDKIIEDFVSSKEP